MRLYLHLVPHGATVLLRIMLLEREFGIETFTSEMAAIHSIACVRVRVGVCV